MHQSAVVEDRSTGIIRIVRSLLRQADRLGTWLPALALRLFVAWEFWESGVEKFRGDNWFHDVRDEFPFPFSALAPDISWQLATWSELLGAACIAVGLGTRFWGVSLAVVTLVAWSAVHAGNGYNVCDNGWKLPLVYLVTLLPLILQGPGRLSVDRWIAARLR